MMLAANTSEIISSGVIFLLVTMLVWVCGPELRRLLISQERQFDEVLRKKLLLDVSPRLGVAISLVVTLILTVWLYLLTGSVLGGLLGLAIGLVLPSVVLRYLRKQRLAKLEAQLVDGVHTLASGVRAGLNLVQAMQLVARDGPIPMRQEFRHLLQEYEFGIPLEEAMNNAALRIGSGDYRLLFAALETHRQRGGDLGETLDRIAESIREIQRLENRVKALTAEGRATARWLGAMPIVVMAILYFVVDASAVREMFADPLGKVIILAIVMLNVIGFLWIRKIVSLDL